MYIPPSVGFRGFIWEPESEQDVVVLFGRLVERGDIQLGLDYTWTAFPDCVAIDTSTGTTVNIEFEFRSSSFLTHVVEWRQLAAVDASARWWIVWWKDDLTERQRSGLTGIEINHIDERLEAEQKLSRIAYTVVARRVNWRAHSAWRARR
jgi:hypothetical protein